MSAWLKDETSGVDIFALLRDRSEDRSGSRAAQVTASGAAWLAGASPYPRSTLSQWEARPGSPGVLPCGSAFDVVNVPALFGRRVVGCEGLLACLRESGVGARAPARVRPAHPRSDR